ncbi:unnamed protein product, partial [Phaeothamnion confervicola]
ELIKRTRTSETKDSPAIRRQMVIVATVTIGWFCSAAMWGGAAVFGWVWHRCCSQKGKNTSDERRDVSPMDGLVLRLNDELATAATAKASPLTPPIA